MAELWTTESRKKLATVADVLAVAIAVSLPWSTSATAILVGLWFFTLVPVLRWDELRREILTPAGGLPVLLVLLGVAGMLWADVTLLERWKGTRFVSQAAGDTVAAGAIPSIRARELGLRGLSLVVRCTPGRYGHCHRRAAAGGNVPALRQCHCEECRDPERRVCHLHLRSAVPDDGSHRAETLAIGGWLRCSGPRHAREYFLLFDRPHRACHDFRSVRSAGAQDPQSEERLQDYSPRRWFSGSLPGCLRRICASAPRRSRSKRRNTKGQTKEHQRANGWNFGKNRSSSYGRRR